MACSAILMSAPSLWAMGRADAELASATHRARHGMSNLAFIGLPEAWKKKRTNDLQDVKRMVPHFRVRSHR